MDTKMLCELETCGYKQSRSYVELTHTTLSFTLPSPSQMRRGRHLKIKITIKLQIKAVLEICSFDVLLNA